MNVNSAINAKKSHCSYGHPFDQANTLMRGPGKAWRKCRACGARQAKDQRIKDGLQSPDEWYLNKYEAPDVKRYSSREPSCKPFEEKRNYSSLNDRLRRLDKAL